MSHMQTFYEDELSDPRACPVLPIKSIGASSTSVSPRPPRSAQACVRVATDTTQAGAVRSEPAENSVIAPLTPTGTQSPGDLPKLVVALAIAVLVPIVAFVVITGFLGRMTAVFLVASAVFGAQGQAGAVRIGSQPAGFCTRVQDLLLCAGMYGAVMAAVAGLFS